MKGDVKLGNLVPAGRNMKRIPFIHSIAFRLMLITMALVILILAASTVMTSIRQRQETESEVRDRLTYLSDLFTQAFEIIAPRPAGKETIDYWLDKVFTSPLSTGRYNIDIAYVIYVYGRGQVLYEYPNRKFLQHDAAGTVLQPHDYYGRELPGIKYWEHRIMEPDGVTVRYKLVMGYTTRFENQELYNTIIFQSILAVLFILIGFLFAWAIAHRWSRPIMQLTEAMAKVEAGDYGHKLETKRRDEIGLITESFNKMSDGLKEREFIRTTFKRFVTKTVAEQILKHPEELSLMGKNAHVTVMFADIRGFTPMSETMEPEDVVDLLNNYFGRMVDIIFRYEGALDKFLGDGLMAFWNAPIEQEDAALKACQAAIEMQKEMVKFNREQAEAGKRTIAIGIGINTGEVVAGSIGSEQKMEYTVVGDNVNLASRIVSQSERGQILISESTFLAIGKRANATALAPIMVKGKSQPIKVYILHDIEPA
jgi:class 3 adenylate cyclase